MKRKIILAMQGTKRTILRRMSGVLNVSIDNYVNNNNYADVDDEDFPLCTFMRDLRYTINGDSDVTSKYKYVVLPPLHPVMKCVYDDINMEGNHDIIIYLPKSKLIYIFKFLIPFIIKAPNKKTRKAIISIFKLYNECISIAYELESKGATIIYTNKYIDECIRKKG